jgi:hypothetical protein
MSAAPPIIWLDERVAARMATSKDPELAERGVDQVRYIIQNRVNDLVAAARGPLEIIVQIHTYAAGVLYGLSSAGRLYALGTVDGQPEAWHLLAEGLEFEEGPAPHVEP